MRTAATPREVQELLDQLEAVPADRRVPIIRMTFRIVGLCPVCDEPVRACDSRRLVDEDRLAHVRCLEGR